MKYDGELVSGVVIHIANFIKTNPGIQKLMGGGGDSDIQPAWRSGNTTTRDKYKNFILKAITD